MFIYVRISNCCWAHSGEAVSQRNIQYHLFSLYNHSNFVMNMMYMCVYWQSGRHSLRSIIVKYHISRDWLLNLVRFVV